MTNNNVKLKPEELRSAAFGSVGAAYSAIGGAFEHPIVLFHLVNDLDEDILVSFFNDEDHIFVKTGSFVLYDIAANSELPSGYRSFEKGTIVSVKRAGGAPTSGSVYLMTFYASGS